MIFAYICPLAEMSKWCLPPRSVATSVKGLFRVHRPCAVAMGREATRRDPIHLASARVEAHGPHGVGKAMSTIFMQLANLTSRALSLPHSLIVLWLIQSFLSFAFLSKHSSSFLGLAVDVQEPSTAVDRLRSRRRDTSGSVWKFRKKTLGHICLAARLSDAVEEAKQTKRDAMTLEEWLPNASVAELQLQLQFCFEYLRRIRIQLGYSFYRFSLSCICCITLWPLCSTIDHPQWLFVQHTLLVEWISFHTKHAPSGFNSCSVAIPGYVMEALQLRLHETLSAAAQLPEELAVALGEVLGG